LTNFCHISPTAYLSKFCNNQTHHLLLAHLVEEDDAYTQWYVDNHHRCQTYILDNSAFEMYKQGREMYPSDKLIQMGRRVCADYIVMSDYPNEPSSRTIEAAKLLAPQFKAAGFGTFFVPQSQIGDLEDYIEAFAWAAQSPLVDYIGVSILGVPNAFGVEKNNKLQRYLSRNAMMNILEKRGLLALAQANQKKIHFLGMVDGPNEIELCKRFRIDTWDSSAAVWAGLNNIRFDNSPTGLINGKYEEEVNFHLPLEATATEQLHIVDYNVNYIDTLCRKA
jgi:hypothetical protein